MDQATNVRQLPTQFDERGNPFWTTRMSKPDNSYAQIAKAPNRVIPVIFASSILAFPATLGTMFTGGWGQTIVDRRPAPQDEAAWADDPWPRIEVVLDGDLAAAAA